MTREWALEVAKWIEQEQRVAQQGLRPMDMRPFWQNVDLIVVALREYAQRVEREE